MIANINNLITILGKIKDVRRRGWIKRDVVAPESDADHMYSMAMEILLMAPPQLNKLHCLELALTHDLPEIYSSDFIPGEIMEDEKHALELAAMQKLATELNFPKLIEWFNEYEQQSSPEAKFVRCIDKTDNVITAAYYEREGRTDWPIVSEFSANALNKIAQVECCGQNVCVQTVKNIVKTFDDRKRYE